MMLFGRLLKDGYGDYAVLPCLHFQSPELRSVKHSPHTVGAAGEHHGQEAKVKASGTEPPLQPTGP